jgi:hypothetical protein
VILGFGETIGLFFVGRLIVFSSLLQQKYQNVCAVYLQAIRVASSNRNRNKVVGFLVVVSFVFSTEILNFRSQKAMHLLTVLHVGFLILARLAFFVEGKFLKTAN